MFARSSVRGLHTARALCQSAQPVAAAARAAANTPVVVRPVRRVGALRGGFTGFLFGVSVTGAAAYYYLFDEYQAGQKAILSDVIALRESLQELRNTVAEIKKTSDN